MGDAVGSWDGSLKIEFDDNAHGTKKTDAAILGEMHYIKVSWTVGTSPLSQKINWYVDDCTVSDAADANKKVDVIENQCFASVISAINTSTNMLSSSDFKFTFKSFSFNMGGNGSQKLTCNINFCLIDNNECSTATNKSNLSCIPARPNNGLNLTKLKEEKLLGFCIFKQKSFQRDVSSLFLSLNFKFF